MSLVKTWRRKYQNYSKREKVFLFLIVVFGIISFGLLGCVLIDSNESNVCLTKECIEAAHHILSTLDETVDPCENFYNFTCGNFFKTAIAQDLVSHFTVLDENMNLKLKQIIAEERSDEKNLTRSFRNQRKFYRACMNTTAMDEDKDQTFLEDLKYVIGGWPLSQGYVLDLFWPEVMLRAREKGMHDDWFLGILTYFNQQENKIYLELRPPTRVHYHTNECKEQDIQRIVAIAEYWGSHIIGAAWEARKSMEFAKNLSIIMEKANASKSNKTDSSKITKISKLREFNFTSIEWLQFLRNFTGVESLSENDEIVLNMNGDDYFKDLYYLLQKTETKYGHYDHPSRGIMSRIRNVPAILGTSFWVDYVALFQILEDCQYLSSKVQDFCKDLISSSYENSRSKFCLEQTLSQFGGVAETQQIRETITPDKLNDITEMIEAIEKEMEDTIKRIEWMDDTTKGEALKHLKNITSAIGWTAFNETLFERFNYVKGEITSNNLVRIKHDLNRQVWDYHFKDIKKVLSHNFVRDWYFSTPKLEVNALYFKFWDVLVLLTPILEPPVYDIRWPKYLNYGALGSIIGHEFTHAFCPLDAESKKSLKYYEYTDYWTNQTHENYESATNCMVEEYVKYTKEIGMQLENKTKTLEENIADFTGLNLAYKAYQNWAYYNGGNRKLPGIKYTSNQLFWILSSTYTCVETKLLSGAYKHPEIEPNESHAIDSFRSNGPIRNSPYFATDFGCPKGSKMNPEEKCQVFV